MTATAAPAAHPAWPGFTAAFITGNPGEPFTYLQYSANVNPASLFSGDGNTSAPYPVDIPALDAQLAADACLRIGDWSWTDDIYGCTVRQITVPAGMVIRDRYDRTHSAWQAIEVIAAGTSTLTVAARDEDGKTPPHLKANLLPVNPAFKHGARVALAGGVAYSPQVSRTRIAVYQLAADIAEAASLIAAVPWKTDGNGILTAAGIEAAK